jgi:hypothetical protein
VPPTSSPTILGGAQPRKKRCGDERWSPDSASCRPT